MWCRQDFERLLLGLPNLSLAHFGSSPLHEEGERLPAS
jgi:hypothetical protein